MDQAVLSYAAIMAALAVAVVSPGPSFLIIAKTAASKSRGDGLAAAFAMGIAGQIFVCGALFGVHVCLLKMPWLYIGLRILGGLYLLYIASLLWRYAMVPLAIDTEEDARHGSWRKSFRLGFLTQISNPKTIIFFASLFSALLPPVLPHWLLFSLPPSVFVVEAGWYSLVALALSSNTLSASYLKLKTPIDRLAALILCAIALTLLVTSLSTLR